VAAPVRLWPGRYLTTATVYREMEMRFWLERAEAETGLA